MYSRNLSKNTVRASPTYSSAKYTDIFPSSYPPDESAYRYRIPPGYDGNRFSRSPSFSEPEPKHHTAVQQGPTEPVQRESPHDIGGNAERNASDIVGEVETDVSETEKHTVPSTTDSPSPDPISAFVSALKNRVSGEDLLLIVIIVMLAAEGGEAEIPILLLSLLLLVK